MATSSQAQSLSEVVTSSTSGIAEAEASAANWATDTQPDPPKPSETAFDHWQAKITLTKPSFLATKKKAEPKPTYSLHGPLIDAAKHAMKGIASYYQSGKRTATGEAFNPNDLTAAHRTLPFGTRVRVTRVDTGQSVIVRINDRGPFKPGRVIDLSRRAAEDLRMTDKGLTAVKLEVINREASAEPEPLASAPTATAHLVENVSQRSLRR